MNTTEQKRKIRNYLANRRRLAMSHGRRERVMCVDGPYAGKELILSAGFGPWECSTAVLRIGNHVGRYVAKKGSETNYWRDLFALVWEEQR